MAYNWTYIPMSSDARITIQSGDDIRHLDELDEKQWTIHSCPIRGLELSKLTLGLLDEDGDGHIHVQDIRRAAARLCKTLVTPDVLLCSTPLHPSDIADEAIREVAKELAVDDEVTVEMVQAVIEAVDVPLQSMPAKPFDDEYMEALRACRDDYGTYFRTARLAQAGLATLPDNTMVPGMTEEAFMNACRQLDAWDKAATEVEQANRMTLEAAKDYYMPLMKLVLLHRDFYTLLRNFVSLEDFYTPDRWAIFQAGTLVIDQRACQFTMRVDDMDKHIKQAGLSGMFLVYCDCTNRMLNRQMRIVAAVTMGDIRNLKVGKNAIFYDREGRDWEAVVVHIIDNPISIYQAFFYPYRKLGQWINKMVEKADKEDVTVPTDTNTPPFDIAKFAGIFAALGMALGYIGEFFSTLIKGIHQEPAWQTLLWVLGLVLIISLPSMLITWIKIHKRNIAPLLNANGWAVNADINVSVLFGTMLTEQSKFPIVALKDPLEIRLMHRRHRRIVGMIILALLVIAAMVAWRWNLWPSMPGIGGR